MKRRFWSAILALVMALTLLPMAAVTAEAATYSQDEARSILRMVNDFRASSPTCKTQDGGEEVYSGLKPLRYSWRLEEIAKTRAEEISRSFSHTRPDGTICFTAEASDGTQTWAENIAKGQPSAERVFVAWREDNDDYAGQGHRRNMLGDYDTIGIACAVVNGTKYWVQEFGWGDNTANPCAGGSHTGGTEVWGYVAATATSEGYSGDKVCKGCGTMLEKGKAIPKTAQPAATKPGAPASVSAKALSNGTVQITWSKVTGVDYYQVWRMDKKGATPGVCIGVYTANTTSSYSRQLKPEATYYYRVRAYKYVDGKKVFGAYGPTASATTPKMGVAATVTATAAGKDSVKVTWSKVNNAELYEVWRMDVKGKTPGVCIGIYKADTFSCTSRQLKPGTTYYYRVRAYRYASSTRCYGTYSATVSATTKK